MSLWSPAAPGGIGSGICAVPVTDSAALSTLARRLDEQYGRLDILVNCHGATRFIAAENLDALDDELIDRMLATNVRGTFAARYRQRRRRARNEHDRGDRCHHTGRCRPQPELTGSDHNRKGTPP